MRHVLATFGQFERWLIGQRTKDALAVTKASGVRLGRLPTVPQSVVRRPQRQRERGDSLRKIADDLNESGAATAQGGVQWYAATVRHVLLRRSYVPRPGRSVRRHLTPPRETRWSSGGCCRRGSGLPGVMGSYAAGTPRCNRFLATGRLLRPRSLRRTSERLTRGLAESLHSLGEVPPIAEGKVERVT
jgi:recombinase